MKLLKTTAISIINILLRIIFGLLINKIIAVSAGPAGLATFAQFQNVIQITVQGSQLGILSGYTKYLSHYKNKKSFKNDLQNTTINILALGTAFGLLILILCSSKIITFMNVADELEILIYLIAITVVFYNLGAYLNATLVGFEFPVISSSLNLLQTVTLLFFALPLALWFGVSGAVIGLLLSQVLWSLITYKVTQNLNILVPTKRALHFSFGILRRLRGFMFSGLVVAISGPIAMLIIRAHAIDVLGERNVGYYQALQSMSMIYIGVISTVISTYYFPKFSKGQNLLLRTKNDYLVAEAMIFSLALFSLFGVAIYFLRDQLFYIAFSKEFVAASEYVIYQLVGDSLRVIIIVISYFLLARAEQLKFIIVEITGACSYVTLIFYLVEDQVFDMFFAYILTGLITVSVSVTSLIIKSKSE